MTQTLSNQEFANRMREQRGQSPIRITPRRWVYVHMRRAAPGRHYIAAHTKDGDAVLSVAPSGATWPLPVVTVNDSVFSDVELDARTNLHRVVFKRGRMPREWEAEVPGYADPA